MKFISSGQNIHGTTGVASSLQSLAMSLLQSTRCLMDCSAFRSTGSQRLLKLFSLFPLTYSSLFSLDSYVSLSPFFFFNTCSHPMLLFSFTYFFITLGCQLSRWNWLPSAKDSKVSAAWCQGALMTAVVAGFFFFRVTPLAHSLYILHCEHEDCLLGSHP